MSGWTDKQSAQNVTILSGRSPLFAAFAPCARCSFPQLQSPGVRLAEVSGLGYDGEGQAVAYPEGFDGILKDMDGSLTGVPGDLEELEDLLVVFSRVEHIIH